MKRKDIEAASAKIGESSLVITLPLTPERARRIARRQCRDYAAAVAAWTPERRRNRQAETAVAARRLFEDVPPDE